MSPVREAIDILNGNRRALDEMEFSPEQPPSSLDDFDEFDQEVSDRYDPNLTSDNYDRDLEDDNEGFLNERVPAVPPGDSAASREGITDDDIEMMEYENDAEIFEAGYQDALNGKDPIDRDTVYMQGYEEGLRDRRSSRHADVYAYDPGDAEIYYKGRVVSTRQTPRKLIKEAISRIAQRARISVWVGDLAAYNAGRLVGDWFELPVADVERDIINQVLEPNNEEFLIMDYETTLGIRINETDNLEELNRLAETVNDWDAEQLEVFPAALDIIRDREEAVDTVNRNDYLFIYADSHAELAEYYIEETGLLNGVDENIARYFDIAAFGRDLAMDFYETDNGYVGFN